MQFYEYFQNKATLCIESDDKNTAIKRIWQFEPVKVEKNCIFSAGAPVRRYTLRTLAGALPDAPVDSSFAQQMTDGRYLEVIRWKVPLKVVKCNWKNK